MAGSTVESRAVWRDPWLGVIVLAAALVYGAASIVRYAHLDTGLDLAIFGQAVWHYSHFAAPISTIKGEDILGDHFHPIVAILAPLYWVWANPQMLLLAQAVLVAASIVPVFLFARRRLPRAAALLLAVAYAAFWGVNVGVVFDFHELAFAPVLIASAILAADRRHMRACWVSAGLLLLVKEDMAFVVLALGVVLLTRRAWWNGIAMVVVATVWYELATQVFIPDVAGHAFTYWSYGQLGAGPASALWGLLRAPWKLATIGLSPSVKANTILLLFLPFLFASVASRLMIVALPLLLERFLSTTPAYWGTSYHYSLAIAPVLAMGAADGFARFGRALGRLDGARLQGPNRRGVAVILVGLSAVSLVLNLVVTHANAQSTFGFLTAGADHYLPAQIVSAGKGALRAVPPDASVVAPTNLAAPLSSRERIDPFDSASVADDEYLVVNVVDPACCSETQPAVATGDLIAPVLARRTPVYYADGWLVERAPPRGTAAGLGVLSPIPAGVAARLVTAADHWGVTGFVAIAHAQRCAATRSRGGTGLTACLDGDRRSVRASSRAVLAQLAVAASVAVGPCRQLASAATTATRYVAALLGFILSSTTSARVRAGYADFAGAENASDPAGMLERFVALCTPRAGATSARPS